MDFFAIMNNVPLNKFFCGLMFSFLLGIYLVEQLLSHEVILYLIFWGTLKLFSKVAIPFNIPASYNVWRFQFLYILPMFVIVCLLIIAILVGVIVVAKLLSHVWPFAAPSTVALQAPLSMEVFRQEYWSGLAFSSLGMDPTQVSCLAGRFFTTEPPGKPLVGMKWYHIVALICISLIA